MSIHKLSNSSLGKHVLSTQGTQVLPSEHGRSELATRTPRPLRMAYTLSLLTPTRAVLPDGNWWRASTKGLIATLAGVLSLMVLPSTIDPGLGSWMTESPRALATASTVCRDRVVWLLKTWPKGISRTVTVNNRARASPC